MSIFSQEKNRIRKPRHKRSSKDFKVGAELSGFNSSRLKVLVTKRALSISDGLKSFYQTGTKLDRFDLITKMDVFRKIASFCKFTLSWS